MGVWVNMKKALLVTTISGFVPQFEMNSVRLLQENNYEVHYATNYNNVFYGKDNSKLDGTGIVRHQIDFSRTPYSKQTFIAFRQLDKLIKDNSFDVIHCHTPIGSFLARYLGDRHHVKTIIYTAHGFHFYQGAPLVNRVIYKTAERLMAHHTDALITINQEDYKNACSFKYRNQGKPYFLHGAGIDTKRFSVIVDRSKKRKELDIGEKDFVILSVGELNKNKNHETIIRVLSTMECSNIKYLICGEGESKFALTKLIIDSGLQDCVRLLGYRNDIPDICCISDIFVFPSYREGLPIALMEAMATGLPAVASEIRGNVDLIENGVNGYLVNINNPSDWRSRIQELMSDGGLRKSMHDANKVKMQKYDKLKTKEELRKIYEELNLI